MKGILIGLGTLVGLVSGGIAIYQYVLPEQTEVSFEVLSAFSVLDVKDNVEGLQITFNGENLQEKNLDLRIYSVRVTNTGDVNILEDHHNRAGLWGIRVDGGKVIRAEILSASSAYLKDSINPGIDNENTVRFGSVFFDKGATFTVNILATQAKEMPFALARVGKISGIELNEDNTGIELKGEQKNSFGSLLLLQGNIFANAVRFVADVSLAIGLLFLVVWLVEWLPKAQRSYRIYKYKRWKKLKVITAEHQVLFSEYRENGSSNLRKLAGSLKDTRRLEAELSLATSIWPKGTPHFARVGSIGLSLLLSNLLSVGSVAKDQSGRVRVSESLAAELKAILDYLK